MRKKQSGKQGKGKKGGSWLPPRPELPDMGPELPSGNPGPLPRPDRFEQFDPDFIRNEGKAKLKNFKIKI